MSFSETFAVVGLVAAGLVALAFAVSEPPLVEESPRAALIAAEKGAEAR